MKHLKISGLLSGITLFLLLALLGCATPLPPSPMPRTAAESHLKKGYDYYNAGQFSEAKAEFVKAIELDPDFPEAYLGRGHAEQNLEQWEEAIKDFDKAIELDPTMPG